MKEACIISVIYQEPEWKETEKCLEALNMEEDLYFVDRQGTRSLSRAINAGVNAFGKGYEYCWIVTNVTFEPDILGRLIESIKTGYAGVTPAFNSDHKFCRPGEGLVDVPFIEFTAPLVRTDVVMEFPLDESMPYWGHDLDWGYRVRKAKHKLGCLRSVSIGHTYIRDSKSHPVTLERQKLRKATDAKTTRALIAKHGANWRRKLKWQE